MPRPPEMLRRAREVMAEEGFSGFLSRAPRILYRWAVRPCLPIDSRLVYNGVVVARVRKLFDTRFPGVAPYDLDDIADYEATLVAALRSAVQEGDRVVVVGGGLGVTAVVAAQRVGPTGRVLCYEGAAECVRDVRLAARVNGVSPRLTVMHAVVGREIALYGAPPKRGVLHPCQLPECDVLELDCEGSEVDILAGMRIRPRTILVETHGLYGASTERVSALLRELGYDVTCAGLAEPRESEFCRANDIRVLVGIRQSLDAA